MSKAILVMDMPGCCLECPLCYKADKLSLGDFRYQILYRCRMEPDDIEEVYLKDIIHKRQDWCPLKPMPKKMECAYQSTIGEMAFKVAIESLEKQIPKKVINTSKGDKLRFETCARCGRRISNVEGGNYCQNCGQAIDWSEEE